ncbi:hypothetical protein, partial [Flavobacterium sp. XGLA_31]|uniref:hypothetical protein n=1 Tax=Flavobacterium sp. XGLA_31 TaxID=3447666 RepID=UPI003F35F61B
NTNEDATITINLSPTPNAGTAVTVPPVCPFGTFDLNTLLTGQDPAGSWFDSALQPVTSPIDISTFIEGTYTYTYRV